jgi:hypothetical protein
MHHCLICVQISSDDAGVLFQPSACSRVEVHIRVLSPYSTLLSFIFLTKALKYKDNSATVPVLVDGLSCSKRLLFFSQNIDVADKAVLSATSIPIIGDDLSRAVYQSCIST